MPFAALLDEFGVDVFSAFGHWLPAAARAVGELTAGLLAVNAGDGDGEDDGLGPLPPPAPAPLPTNFALDKLVRRPLVHDGGEFVLLVLLPVKFRLD